MQICTRSCSAEDESLNLSPGVFIHAGRDDPDVNKKARLCECEQNVSGLFDVWMKALMKTRRRADG